MNYLEEQTDGEAMINSIQNEKKTRKIDRLARSLLIQRLSNDIYSLIDSNETAKDLWDTLERQMCSSEYDEQDRKAAIFYEYDTFKANEGEELLYTYLRYLQVINDLKKCGYKKDNYELNYKFLKNLQPEWKQYGTLMRQTKNLMDINIDALYNILKQNQGDVNDALGYKKKVVVVTSDPLALVAEKTKVSKRKEKVVVSLDSEGSGADDFSELKTINALLAKAFNPRKDMSKVKCYNCKKEGYFAKDCKKAKVKDNNYYKTKMLLAKKDSDEQVLLAEDQAWMESSSDYDQEINSNMVFMAQIEKVLSESDGSSSSAEETIAKVAYYTSESEKIFHDAIESASENFIENHIDSQKDYDKSEVDHNDSEEKEHLADKLIRKFNHKIAKCQKRIETANQQSKDLENQNKDLQDKYDVLINQVKHVVVDTHTECQAQYAKLEKERYEYMIRYSTLCDNDKKHRKKIDEQEILFDKMSRHLSKMNKNVKRYSRKDLLSCNNSHLGETSSAYVCNDAMNVSCNSRMCDLFDENNLFIFDDESVRIFPVSKMFFRKKPHDSMNHMTGNRALLTNFVEKFLGTVRFGNNDFAVIAGYGDVVIGSMTIKKFYYVFFLHLKDEDSEVIISFIKKTQVNLQLDLRPTLYDEKVIGLGYTLMFLTHSDEALEIEKFKRSRENKIEFSYDYRNLNASYVNEKINFEDDYFQNIINPDFEKIDSSFQKTSSLKPYVPNVILEKIIIDLEDEVVNLLEKEKVNLETIESLKSKDLDTFTSVRRPKNSGVIWKKKGSSNTFNVGLSAVNVSNLNKNVKRYSRKYLLAYCPDLSLDYRFGMLKAYDG
nr:hypothetical protein [Tanacetum cinerariifolium]